MTTCCGSGAAPARTAPARLENETANGVEFGAVGYTHAGGVDRPLLAWKLGVGLTPAMVVVPHMNWRGLFGSGTYLSGTVNTYPIVWPGFNRTAWHKDQPNQQQTKVWTGSLLEGQRDASGQMYMRNRYYDPVTGQFTQTDPISLAGGLNAYGFAAGDPVSYSDPYGLCPDHLFKEGKCPGGMSREEYAQFELLFISLIGGDASDALMGLLEQGRIHVDQPMEGEETRVQVVHHPDERPSDLRIGPTFWSEGSNAAAFTISHDYGHVKQKEARGLLYGEPTNMTLQEWNTITRTPKDKGPGEAFFDASQIDANKYACSVTIPQSSGYHTLYCN